MKNIWVYFTILILITLHLKVASISNFGISLGFLLIPIWFYLTFKLKAFKYKKAEFYAVILMLILPFIPGRISCWLEFIKTYGQFVIAYFFVIRAINKDLKIESKTIKKTLLIFQLILLITIIFQFVMVKILGDTSFYNLFGELQLYYQRNEPGFNRMKAFYLEPSYLGFVTIAIFWTRHYLDKANRLIGNNLIITIIILFFAKSAFAFVSLFLLLVLEIYYKSKKISALYGILAFVFIVSMSYIFSNELITVFRLNELSDNTKVITSGFMRVVLPIQVLYRLIFIDHQFLGLTFGQLDVYVKSYFMHYGESSISNSFFLIIGYFGLLGLLFYILLIFLFFKTKHIIIKSFILLSVLNLNNAGAFMTLQYSFVAFLIPFLAFINYDKNSIDNYSSQK